MNEIEPALTPEEWEYVAKTLDALADGADAAQEFAGRAAVEAMIRANRVAESIRNGQPFGFSWEDVERVRVAANAHIDGEPTEPDRNPILAEYLRQIADRIAALLSPRETP